MRAIVLVCTALVAACGAGTSPEEPARSDNALVAPDLESGRPHVLPIGSGNAFATGASSPHLTYYTAASTCRRCAVTKQRYRGFRSRCGGKR